MNRLTRRFRRAPLICCGDHLAATVAAFLRGRATTDDLREALNGYQEGS